MTVSAPVYSAFVPGLPDVPVTMREDAGGITLNSSRAPHVQGSIMLTMPDAGLIDDLDSRENRRLVVDIDGRQFDLGIRRVRPARRDATVSVDVASDEALLADYCPLVDDRAPRALETSLRAVVDYVLSKIGAQLEAGALDADVTAFWALTNLIINPSIANATTGYSAGLGSSAIDFSTAIGGFVGPSALRWTASGSSVARVNAAAVRVNPGTIYSASAYVQPGAGTVPVRLGVRFFDGAGSAIKTLVSEQTPIAAGAWSRAVLTGFAVPDGAATAVVFVDNMEGAAGRNTYADGFMFVASVEQVPYFDGSNAPAGYVTAWDETQHLSTSTRTPILERAPESTVWSAGRSGMEFLAPLIQSFGFRLVCDEQRLWTLRDENHREAGDQTFRTAANLHDADEEISRDSDDWYDGAVFVYRWTTAGVEQVVEDSYAVPGATKIIRREIDSPYPGPGRAEYAVRRAQGKGRTVMASRQALWDEKCEQTFSALLDGTPIQVGIAEVVEFDIAENTVTTTSRTTTIPAPAWMLIPAGESWLDSPVGESWIGEVI